METKLDRFGRIVIPKSIRSHLGLEPGTVLRIRRDGNVVTLTPAEEEAPLVEEDGLLVFTGEPAGDLIGAVQRERERRIGELVRGAL